MKCLVAACLLAFSLNSFASSGSKPQITDLVKQEVLRSDLQVFANDNAIVIVSFKIDENGQILIREANTNNENLCNQVMQIINKMVLPVTAALDEVYQIKFVFRWL
jgi:plastocyanin domain-containing protein